MLFASRTGRPLVVLALVFGVFYTGLGVWGVMVYHPLGLELDLPENIFHLIAGPLALLLGVLSVGGWGRLWSSDNRENRET